MSGGNLRGRSDHPREDSVLYCRTATSAYESSVRTGCNGRGAERTHSRTAQGNEFLEQVDAAGSRMWTRGKIKALSCISLPGSLPEGRRSLQSELSAICWNLDINHKGRLGKSSSARAVGSLDDGLFHTDYGVWGRQSWLPLPPRQMDFWVPDLDETRPLGFSGVRLPKVNVRCFRVSEIGSLSEEKTLSRTVRRQCEKMKAHRRNRLRHARS